MPQLQTFEFEGCRFAYRVEGEGPPLMMIQGVGAQGTAYNPQIEILKARYACLTFDNRGIGASQPAAKKITVSQMARDALALMDHVGWSSAHIIGHSLGGLVALELALMARPRVRSLTLLNTFASGAAASRMTLRLLWIVFRLQFAPRPFRRDAFMELVLAPGEGKAKVKGLAERMARVLGHDVADLPSISNQQLSAMRAADLTGRLAELSGIPTLVISGEKDMIARPSLGRAIASGIPGARYLEIAGASHAFPILEAERCAALTMQHLAGAETRRAG
ncbi:MAG: alpha/beta fold hydrolase [Bryobacteraceae bacterium]